MTVHTDAPVMARRPAGVTTWASTDARAIGDWRVGARSAKAACDGPPVSVTR